MSELAVGSLSGLAANSYVIDVASGSQLTQPGMTLAAESVQKTDTFSASVASGANVAVTDLSITHTLQNASNKLLIMAHFGVAGSTNQRANLGIAIANDGSLIGIADAAGSRTLVAAGGIEAANSQTFLITLPHIHLLYAPGDTSSHTYTVRAINVDSGTQTIYVNRSQDDTDSVGRTRGVSTLTIMEIAG